MNYEKGMKFQNRKSGKVGTVTEVDEKYMCVVLMYEDGKDSRVSMNTIKKSFKKLDEFDGAKKLYEEPVVEEKVEEPVVEETVEQTVEEKPKKKRQKKEKTEKVSNVDKLKAVESYIAEAINEVGGYNYKKAPSKLAYYVFVGDTADNKNKFIEVFYKPRKETYEIYMKEATYKSIEESYKEHEYNATFINKYFIARKELSDIKSLISDILQADINKKTEETEKTDVA